jgi:DNA-binding NarL/FixJ family response regulator
MKIRVLLVDDQALIRAGFRALIDSTDDLEVVGEAADGTEALVFVRSTLADVVLMDIRMPGMDGIEATRAITADDDLAGVRVLILTTFEIDSYVIQAIRAGASGFVSKGVEPHELLDAIRTIALGESLLSPRATSALIAEFSRNAEPSANSVVRRPGLDLLTSREREVVVLAARGNSNDEIANELYISRFTAKTHVNRAMMKLDVRDRAQLVVLAYQVGLVRFDAHDPERHDS